MRAALPRAMEAETRAQILMQLGAAEVAQGRLDEGIASLEASLRLDPSLAAADVMLGQAYSARGQDAVALGHLGRALDRRPDDVQVLLRTAWLLATAGDQAVLRWSRAR